MTQTTSPELTHDLEFNIGSSQNKQTEEEEKTNQLMSVQQNHTTIHIFSYTSAKIKNDNRLPTVTKRNHQQRNIQTIDHQIQVQHYVRKYKHHHEHR